jgi:hypothetical protein
MSTCLIPAAKLVPQTEVMLDGHKWSTVRVVTVPEGSTGVTVWTDDGPRPCRAGAVALVRF